MANDDLDLLHNFIHDLKAPLSSAKSFIDLLVVSGELTAEQKHFAHRAQTNMSRMNRIITALLEYARMESGGEPLEIETCDLLEVIDDVLDDLEASAKERQVSFGVAVAPDAQFVQADNYLLHSILMNLVSNAIKYNRIGGELTITSRNVGEFIEISVQDTGLGIPESALDRVFERFYRVEEKEHQQVKGTGIGLAMVKGIIEKHGGSITVQSQVGEGSDFIFTLPHANTSSPDYDREPMDGLADEFQEDRDIRDDHDSGEQSH